MPREFFVAQAGVRLFVGVTDFDWFRFLASRPEIDEVNFWQPSGAVGIKALAPGGVFLFKLRIPRNFIVGGGVFAHWSALPVSLAWEAWLDGASVRQPARGELRPSREYLDWHASEVFRG